MNAQENIPQPALAQEKVDVKMEQPKVDAVQSQDASVQKTAQEPEKPEDPNWKAFREARKKDRADREAAEKRAAEKEAEAAALKAAMEAAFTKNPNTYMTYREPTYEEETEDQKIEKKVQAALAARDEQYRQQQEEREVREYPNRLKQTYHDFNQVISQENLDYLDFHYPEVSRPLQRLNDGYDKWSDIYQAVKKFVPNHSTAKKEAQRAEANFAKPKSISSTGLTQPQSAPGSHILSDERKASNWARMQQTLKGLS